MMKKETTIRQNIVAFIEQEGVRIQFLAKCMKLSEEEFMDYLEGKCDENIQGFAKKLAPFVGYEESYFIDEECKLPTTQPKSYIEEAPQFLSEKGKEGWGQLMKLVHLVNIYG